MSKEKKLVMWTVFMVSLLQMINMAIMPAVNRIATDAFPQFTLSSIQTVLSLTGIVMPCTSLLSALLLRPGLVTKKAVVIFGLFMLGFAGILSQLLHSQFWHLAVLSTTSGIASGCYLSTVISIMMDRFDRTERQKISGYQSVFVNLGAVLCGFFGGLLAAWQWYGGYLVMLLGIPMGLVALFTLPKEDRVRVKTQNDSMKASSKMNRDVFYYAAVVMVFMTAYAVCSNNLAVHLAAAGMGGTKLAGTLTSFQMVGGALFGFVFGRVSAVLKDYLLALSFVALGAGLTLLNVFSSSLAFAFIGVFLVGISISMLGPQCVFAASNCVDVRTSAVAASLVNGIAPGLGMFLSPVIYTNLTTAIAGESTNYRYQFVAIVALAMAAVLAVLTTLRARRKKAVSAGGIKAAS